MKSFRRLSELETICVGSKFTEATYGRNFQFCCVPARLYASWQTRRVVKPHRPQMRKCRAKTSCGVLCCAQRTTITLENAWPISCAIAAKQTCRKPATSPSSSTRSSGNRLNSSSTGSRRQVKPLTWHQRAAVLEMRSLNERLSHGKQSITRACRSRNSQPCAEKYGWYGLLLPRVCHENGVHISSLGESS